MRRFIAYLLASITMLLGVGIAFKPVVTSMNADLDFRDGREITFRLSANEETEEEPDEDGEATKYYADVMKSRLESYGVDNYTITTSGKDTIKVTLTTSNLQECDNISKLLCANPEIEICNLTKDDIEPQPVRDEDNYSWHDGKAYLTYSGASTVLVMPIPAQAKTKVEEMIEAAKKYEGNEPEPESNDDPEPEPPKQSIVLWMGRVEGDNYEDKDINDNVKKKIIYDQFNSTNFYYGTNKDAFQITFTPTGADTKSISDAYNQARLMMCLLNAKETLFNCTAINTELVQANVENLLIYGDQASIAMSATFISMIVAFIVISLILTLFYRIGAVASISLMAANTFLAFFVFTRFGAVFNISAMVGLIIVAIGTLVSSIAHNNYLHEEVYKGRNLKKANYEASKKTTMLTVDVSIITALAGIVLYFLGGASISSIGVILVVGSVLNILLNTFVLKGLMWLITNNTNFQDKKNLALFKIDASKVPDLSKEEKPTYFGPFINKDYTKKKKVTGIIAAVLTLASVAGLIAFGSMGKIFNTSNYYASTNEATFSIESSTADQPHPSIDEVTNQLFGDNGIKYNGHNVKHGDVTYFCYQVVDDIKHPKDEPYVYYLQTYKVQINENSVTSDNYSYLGESGTLEDVIDKSIAVLGVTPTEIRTYTNVVYNIPNDVGPVAISSIIVLVSFSVYLLLRQFKPSRVLPLFITSAVGATLSVGFISLARVVATPVLSVSMILTMILTTLMSLFILHKDKSLIKEERLRDVATKKVVLKKANAMAMLPMLIFALISVYAAINFFGFGHKEFLALFFSSAFGMAMSVMILLTWFTPMCDFLDERFSRVKLPKITLRKKDKVKVKSNTPEEAIFIGIND